MKNSSIAFEYKGTADFLKEDELKAYEAKALKARDVLLGRGGEGNDFLGWIDLPASYPSSEEYSRLKKAAEEIRQKCDYLIVIGIGGSYLGARAAIEFLSHSFASLITKDRRKGPAVLFAGNSISQKYLGDLLEVIDGADVCLNVISKSGTTLEPAVAFRILREHMISKYGEEEAAKRIYATTDSRRGVLKEFSDKHGYETFVVPDDVGGRFSVMTAVGMLPIMAAGLDGDAMLRGAACMREICINNGFESNPSLQYAAVRNALYNGGRKIELTVNYEPSLHYIGEWYKQLFGESEGKDHKGIFPAAADLTTDLHSMGQYIQDGERTLMESVLRIAEQPGHVEIKAEDGDPDGLNYLAGKTMAFVNDCAMEGTFEAHISGGVPCMRITMDKADEYTLGQLLYFYEFACGVSGYMLGVNPFNQPGVESYKKNMFRLLGKK